MSAVALETTHREATGRLPGEHWETRDRMRLSSTFSENAETIQTLSFLLKACDVAHPVRLIQSVDVLAFESSRLGGFAVAEQLTRL